MPAVIATAQPAPTVGNEVQGQALEGLVAGDEVVAHRVDDQPQELVLLQHTHTRRDGGRAQRVHDRFTNSMPGA